LSGTLAGGWGRIGRCSIAGRPAGQAPSAVVAAVRAVARGEDGQKPAGLRYCINSVALTFDDEKDKQAIPSADPK